MAILGVHYRTCHKWVPNLALSRSLTKVVGIFIYLVDATISICPSGDAFLKTGN